MGLGRGVYQRRRCTWHLCMCGRSNSNIPLLHAAAGLDVSTLHEAMQLVGGRQIETEASGNVTLETIR